MGQSCLAETGRTVEEDMVQRLLSLKGGFDGDLERLCYLALPNVLREAFRPETKDDFFVLRRAVL